MRSILISISFVSIFIGISKAAETDRSPTRKAIKGDFSMWMQGDRPFFRIDYRTAHRVKNIETDNIIEQYCLDFYEGDRFVGTYYLWNELGSDLPAAETCFVDDVKLDPNWRVEFRLRMFDIGWRDGRRNEEELDHWFEKSFWKFNSVIPVGTDKYKYRLQSHPGMPDLETYLLQSGFQINAVFDFTAKAAKIKQKPVSKPNQ
ncbi:hypothetical protein Pan258_16230 [Symmachiella dynata]|nr:hypothetical protein Pan258_16230 [Symmachiella dynata]